MKKIYNSKLLKVLNLFWGLFNFHISGLAFKWWIFFKDESPSQRLIRHEIEHIRQQKEDGIFKFLIIYFKEYFYLRLIKRKSHIRAYLSISYEKEARKAEKKKWWYNYVEQRNNTSINLKLHSKCDIIKLWVEVCLQSYYNSKVG